MATKKRQNNVPTDKVGQTVQDFINLDGAEEVTAQEVQKNKWKVEAQVPD